MTQKMTNPHALVRKTKNLLKNPCKLSCINQTSKTLSFSFINSIIINANPFWVQLSYFVILSLLGFVALKTLDFKTSSFRPNNVDLLFMAVSAVTVSSMSTVEMEVFSNSQLIVLTILMFMGGEVFVSMIGLQFRKFKYKYTNPGSSQDNIELGVKSYDFKSIPSKYFDRNDLMYKAIRSLGYVVFCYILIVHFFGFILAYIYISFTSSARSVLINKGLSRHTFSIFVTVSTFANCGFVPTNENMMVFKKNPGFLLILIPQILLGSTLYPVVLRALLLILEKITKRVDLGYTLKNSKDMGYGHLLSTVQTFYLSITVFGLVLVQFVVFCSLEWNNMYAMDGLNSYEKMVGSFFQAVNTRYAGEAVFDLSTISHAILVVFIVMMYLPPLTTYLPVQDNETSQIQEQQKSFVEYILFSQLTYLVIFTILICLSERRKMDVDPLNFSVLNIAFEVFSAYGNVGLSTCYSCQRQINSVGHCKEAWYGFVGRWSNNGKFLLILVMLVGRLKIFNKNGGKFWTLSLDV